MNVDTQQILKVLAGAVMPEGFVELPKELQGDAARLLGWADRERRGTGHTPPDGAVKRRKERRAKKKRRKMALRSRKRNRRG